MVTRAAEDTSKAVLVLSEDNARAASLVVETAKGIEVWALDLTRAGTESIEVSKAVESFNVNGDRCSKSLRHGVAATRVDTPADEEIETFKSAAVVAAAMEVEEGVSFEGENTSLREFFVKGDKITGILRIERIGDVTKATLSDSTLPALLSSVLPQEIVEKNLHALPSSLAAVVRKDQRFWEKEGAEIGKAHSALVSSGFFSEDNVRIVNGDLHRVITKTYLYVPPKDETEEKPRPKFRKRLDTIIGDEADIAIVAAPEEGECWDDVLGECLEGVDGDIVAVIAESRPAVNPDDLAGVVAKLDRPFVVGLRDSDKARGALAKLSTPFFIEGDRGYIWAYSGSVAKAKNVSFVATDAKQPTEDTAEDPQNGDALIAEVLKGQKIIKTIMPDDGSIEERFVLGIVLEPEEVDAQKDIYSDAEVRTAAHKFMEQYQNIGLMHRDVVNEQVKILESYVAPVDFEMDGIVVKKGTWLLAVRVLDDELWSEVKEGGLTGFSIGGSAVRVPDRPAA